MATAQAFVSICMALGWFVMQVFRQSAVVFSYCFLKCTSKCVMPTWHAYIKHEVLQCKLHIYASWNYKNNVRLPVTSLIKHTSGEEAPLQPPIVMSEHLIWESQCLPTYNVVNKMKSANHCSMRAQATPHSRHLELGGPLSNMFLFTNAEHSVSYNFTDEPVLI